MICLYSNLRKLIQKKECNVTTTTDYANFAFMTLLVKSRKNRCDATEPERS